MMLDTSISAEPETFSLSRRGAGPGRQVWAGEEVERQGEVIRGC